jgi:hypothetical protein
MAEGSKTFRSRRTNIDRAKTYAGNNAPKQTTRAIGNSARSLKDKGSRAMIKVSTTTTKLCKKTK